MIQSLREDDWAAIVSYDLNTEIVTDFSQTQNELFNGLRTLTYPSFSETNLYDAVHFTLDRLENIDGKRPSSAEHGLRHVQQSELRGNAKTRGRFEHDDLRRRHGADVPDHL